jgi:apolipoprotein N-acyltransferase
MMSRAPEARELPALHARLLAIGDTLFSWAAREADAGARIVFWSEANLQFMKADEPALLDRGAAFAREHGVTLGVAYAAFVPGQGWYENQLALFGPDGRPLARYHKARPVPGDPERGADRHLPVVQTPGARIAGAICFDGDFPDLIGESGRGRADFLMVPASDWRAIDPIHTRMALVRGIENGCSVVRQTNQGLSAAGDAYGRILAQADYFTTRPNVMVSQVPIRGVRTPYARLGDAFAWACVALLLAVAIFGLRSGPDRVQ